jgi:single-strand DNA-binding protein
VEDINNVTLVARLTKDPEMKGSVLPLRLAFSTREKQGDVWGDKSNYIDAVVFGRQAEALCPLLSKGARVVVAGNLEWREWISDGQTRSTVQVIARNVQIVDGKRENPTAPADDTADIPF